MISLFIIYSQDRKQALETTISLLAEMPLYNQCQKTLIVDGETNIFLPQWKQIEVPRVDGEFCWSYMWDAGVTSAQYEKIIYLDSDRLFPPSFLELMNQNIADDAFVFTSYHFMMKQELNKDRIKTILHKLLNDKELQPEDYFDSLVFEPRFGTPVHNYGKNVMSGSTGFTKRTFYRLGGVDPWYRGHGAFADTDFHFAAYNGGCSFVDLGLPELHYPHKKLANNKEVKTMEFRRMCLNNFIYYCHKWGLPSSLAESMAYDCNLKYPAKYVEKKLEDLRQMPRNL